MLRTLYFTLKDQQGIEGKGNKSEVHIWFFGLNDQIGIWAGVGVAIVSHPLATVSGQVGTGKFSCVSRHPKVS